MDRRQPLVIGVTGTFGSGKSTVAKYLASKGFTNISTAAEVRHEMGELGLSMGRDEMIRFSTQRRRQMGAAYFTEKAMAKISGDSVVTDMRHPEEIVKLRLIPRFRLIAVDAPIEKRFERIQARGRLGDGKTLAEFKIKEDQELTGSSGGHNLGQMMASADYKIINDGTLEELQKKVDDVLNQIRNSNIEL